MCGIHAMVARSYLRVRGQIAVKVDKARARARVNIENGEVGSRGSDASFNVPSVGDLPLQLEQGGPDSLVNVSLRFRLCTKARQRTQASFLGVNFHIFCCLIQLDRKNKYHATWPCF